jgi:vacuolar-type H+-ATPase subunit C/Vma6
LELIQSYENRGYPTEYLLARIRGRRTYFLHDWDNFLFSPEPFKNLLSTKYGEFISEHSIEGVWKRFLKEFQWIYFQMNKGLRDVFLPFFLYYEIKNLIVCFRYKTGKGTRKEIENLLHYSLLSGKYKEILMMETDLPVVLEEISNILLFSTKTSLRLKDIFLEQGLKSVEERLTAAFLEHAGESKLHPVMKSFFAYLIDSKNIIALYKYLRWDIRGHPTFIFGGSINESSLKKRLHEKEISEIGKLVYQLTGLDIEETVSFSVEKTLRRGLTKKIRIMGREDSDIGFILEYLWRHYIESLNLRTILYGGQINKDAMQEELIY